MGGLWSISRQTIIQCLRTRAVVVFLLLLAVMLAAMPFALTGDGTLAGRARTFLTYSTSLTATALSVLTVFLTVSAVSEDVRTRTIFSVAVKPVGRWQYILGRWLGVMTLNVLLLVLASMGIYCLATYLRTGALTEAINARDQAAVETEVFTARRRLSPVPKNIDTQVLQRLEELRRTGRYDEAMVGFAARFGDDQAETELYNEIRKQVVQSVQSVQPGAALHWRFNGVDIAGRDYHSTGQVVSVNPSARAMRISASNDVIGRLVFGGPMCVNDVEAWVQQSGKGSIDVSFQAEEFTSPSIASVQAGDTVTLTVEPTIQITYKASAATYPPDGMLRSAWLVSNPSGETAILERNDPVRQPATLTVPARVVGRAVEINKWIQLRANQIARQENMSMDQARAQASRQRPPSVEKAPPGVLTWATDVRYFNQPNAITGDVTSVTILDEDISVLFRVGSFEANFLRGMLMTIIQLAYVAALGMLAGSFLVFPVGCLLVFSLLPFSMFRQYLTESVATYPGVDMQWYIWPGRVLVHNLSTLLPDLEAMSPGRWLVDGMNIPWWSVAAAAIGTFAMRTMLIMLFTCLIFRSRELARVQV